ncbi:ATP-binding protein [filamentous cyanobacterium CCP1]|nr:ATP-binding protein [filamentous cyanobacterium CCP2]PSB68146.1 ATP-binding protein [filamentous cyanobacterium CCP1]
MTEIFGDFEDNLPPSQEYLRIQFSPSSVPLKQRWRNNGLSANFMADFLLSFLPTGNCEMDITNHKEEIQGTICYVANELLENAMKFTDEASPYPISLTLYLLSDRLVFISTNSVSTQSKKKLQDFIYHLLTSDPNQLYTEQLEKSALDENNFSAGLGILTMMNDYSATIGWKLETLLDHPESDTVMTMVQLSL